MRLGIKLLNTNATLNNFRRVPTVKIARGETVDVMIQLVDLDNQDLRYIPHSDAEVQVQIPKMIEVVSDGNKGREYRDYSVDRQASRAFGEDRSIWKITLIEEETKNLASGLIRVILTEPSGKKIALLQQAVKIVDGHE